MKFLCDRCKTRYSIGDDRVRGKILKIRCKNCANVITVREGMTDADAGPPDAAQPRRTAKPTTLAPPAQVSAMPPSNGAKPPAALEEEWYVSIEGEQSGPFSLHEAQRWVGAKPPTAGLHCWSEGFDDWLPVDKVSHFRGLRKKATQSVPVVAPPRPAPPRPAPPPPPEEEPKPLFAATMAALERSAAAAAPMSARATPLGGTPAHAQTPAPSRVTPLGGTPARSTPIGGSQSLPKVTNGSAPHAAIARPMAVPAIPMAKNATGPRPALPLPSFDASDGVDVPTQIEVPPFGDDTATAGAKPARMPSVLPSPFASPASSFGSPAPMFQQPAPMAAPMAAPMVAKPAPMFPPTPQVPVFPAPAAKPAPMPEPEPEGDMEIGEVSRVVNLADLARSNAARKNGAAPRLRTTGGVASIGDPIAAMVATPDTNYASQSAMVPEQSAARRNNTRLYVLLGGVVLVLLIVVGAVVYAVSRNDDDDSTALAHGREIDLSRPDDPHQHPGPGIDKPDVKDPVTPVVPRPQPHRPYVGPGSSKVGSAVVEEPPPTGNSLKPEEVEAMARSQSDATNRCYMRAQRGADAITIGDVKRINVTLTIDREGGVTGVELSDHANDTLGKCLQQRIKGWRFHSSGSGLTTRLTLVFQAS